jgi:translation initiation factor IF-3
MQNFRKISSLITLNIKNSDFLFKNNISTINSSFINRHKRDKNVVIATNNRLDSSFPLFTSIRNSFRDDKTKRVKKSQLKPVYTEPTTIIPTKANSHLVIDLTDENGVELGHLSIKEAKKRADEKELKLVLVDDSKSPPKFKIMKGDALHNLRMELKKERKEKIESGEIKKVMKEKEFDFNLGIEDNDLKFKIDHIKSLYEKGHPITIKIKAHKGLIVSYSQEQQIIIIKLKF